MVKPPTPCANTGRVQPQRLLSGVFVLCGNSDLSAGFAFSQSGSVSTTKKSRVPRYSGSGGRGWIRTTEALSSRFTVCPHWPLGNTPLFCFHRAGVLPGDLFILPQALLFVNSFFKLFRSSAPGCRSGRQRAAGPYPVVQPAAPDCLLILAPAGAFVNREFAFWGGIVVS